METNFLALQVECLETRRLLAGNVAASIDANGDVTIKGDRHDNAVTLEIVDSDTLRFRPDATTSVNGAVAGTAVDIDHGGLRDLRARMRGGDDFLSIDFQATFGNGVIVTGGGTDHVEASSDFTGNLRIALGGGAVGSQQLALFRNVGGNLVIRGGNTRDVISSIGATVDGKARFITRGGSDSVGFEQMTYNSSARFKMGGGDDNVNAIDSILASTTIVAGGAGTDTFLNANSTINSLQLRSIEVEL